MARLKIKNFGPIEENISADGTLADDGFFTVDFPSVTVFIGRQASGKSTLAKLYSTLAWLDKTLTRQSVTSDFVTKEVVKNLCAQQELSEYFRPNTSFSYESAEHRFSYSENTGFHITEIEAENGKRIKLPKIQYVSAARNLLTILYSVDSPFNGADSNTVKKTSGIPFMVNDLNREYIRALASLAKDGFSLPIDNTKVFFDNYRTFVSTNGVDVSMSAASSGIQSITPLLLVSRFLSREVIRGLFEKLMSVSDDVKAKIEKNLSSLGDSSLVEKFKLFTMGGREILDGDGTLSNIELASSRFIPSYLVEIVEEPEQNLFPETQAEVLYQLLECRNSNSDNKLVISTHSPYILTALNNAMLAHDVYSNTSKRVEALPENRTVSFDKVAAYMLEDGRVTSILDKDSRMINAEMIDACSTQINQVFSDILNLNHD